MRRRDFALPCRFPHSSQEWTEQLAAEDVQL